MELRALCLMCAFCLTSGQFFSGTRQNTFQQTSRLSMPRRQLSSQHPDPRLQAQMGLAMQNRLSTRMPGNSLMPTTQVTMAPGIQRNSLGSPHHQPSTKPPPVSLLQFLLGTTQVPRESTPLSISASPHRLAPQTMENIPTSPFRAIQSPAASHAGQNRWSLGSGQTPFSQNQFDTPNNGQNSNPFSSNAFRNPSTPQSSFSPRPGHTQTVSANLLSSQPVQNQMTSQTNNPSQTQSIMSSSNSPQIQQQFSSPRIGQPQPTQPPRVQHHWNPAGSPVQPHSSNSFQSSHVQQQLSPPGIDHSQTGQSTFQNTQRNHDWKTQNSWQSQNQPSQNVGNTLKPEAPGRLESVVTRPTPFSSFNSNKIQPTGFQQHTVHVKTLQPLPSNGFQNNPPYQNIAARRTEQRQFDPQYIETPQTSTTPAPIYNIKTNLEPEPHQTSSLNSLSSRIDQQSSTSVIQNQPYPRPESTGIRQSSLNIVRSLPATHTPWTQRPWQSSTNVHRTLPDTQPDTTRRKNINTHTTSPNAVRNLPSRQSAIPQRMETSSPNIVRTLPIDLQDSLQKRNQGRRTPSISVQKPISSSQTEPQGMRWKQNEVSNSPTTQPTPLTKTEKSHNLQIPGSQLGSNKQQSGPLKQSPLVSNTNTNPLSTGQQPNSSTQKKTGLIPTVINGKKYMINPHFVDLLKGLLLKAGLDMKTDSSVTTVKNDAQRSNVKMTDIKQSMSMSNQNRFAKVGSNHPTNRLSIDGKHSLPQTMLQTQSNYEPPVMKQRIDHGKASTPGINTVAYTNLGTIGQTKPEVINNQVTRTSQNAQVTSQPNSPYQAIRMTSQPQSPYINTMQTGSLRMTTSVTAAPKTESISFTNSISLMTKSPQTITTTTTPLPVKTPAPKRRKALLLPFRDVPNTTTNPVVATTLRQTSAPKSVPNQTATNFSNAKSVTPPPRNFLIGTTKSVGNMAQILTPRYLSDRRTTSTVTTMAPTTRLAIGKLTEPTNFHAMVTEPTGMSTISHNNALDTATMSSPSKSKSLLPETFLNSDPPETLNPPQDQLVQNNGFIEQVSEQTPLQTPDPTEIAVNVQFGFNLGHFRRNKSKKGADKHFNSDGSVINDVFSRSDGLSPSDGIGVHKGFVGFNNKANNVELFVLR